MLVQLIGGWRLAQCGVSFLTLFFDLANAFACTQWETMDAACAELVNNADVPLLRARYRDAVVEVSGCYRVGLFPPRGGRLHGRPGGGEALLPLLQAPC